jgi:hypothetical protein
MEDDKITYITKAAKQKAREQAEDKIPDELKTQMIEALGKASGQIEAGEMDGMVFIKFMSTDEIIWSVSGAFYEQDFIAGLERIKFDLLSNRYGN